MSAADSTANATAAQPYLFFPPEPARVLLPDDLSAEAAAQVAAYQTKKSQLKKELYDAVHEYDGQRFSLLRPNPIKSLAEKQAADLTELETLAEEIRRGLARVAGEGETRRHPVAVLRLDVDAAAERFDFDARAAVDEAGPVGLAAARVQMTRRGRMMVVVLDDGTAQQELSVFNELFEAERAKIVTDEVLVIEGKVRYDEFSGGNAVVSASEYKLAVIGSTQILHGFRRPQSQIKPCWLPGTEAVALSCVAVSAVGVGGASETISPLPVAVAHNAGGATLLMTLVLVNSAASLVPETLMRANASVRHELSNDLGAFAGLLFEVGCERLGGNFKDPSEGAKLAARRVRATGEAR